MAEPVMQKAPDNAAPESSPEPREGLWARWWRKSHPLGTAYPIWIAVGLIVILLAFAQLVGWLIRNRILGF
jgi:hypothetical protein